MTRPSQTIVLLATFGMLVAACGVFDGGDDLTLEDGDWVLRTYATTGGDLADVRADTIISARFDGESITGSGGCNGYFGGYATDGDSISIGPLASTERACFPVEIMTQETEYLAALGVVDSYRIGGETLEMSSGGNLLLVYDFLGTPTIEGTSWTLISYNNGQEAMVSVIIGTEITARFSDDGVLSGLAGCNDYSGGYTVRENKIEVGSVAVTQKFCAEPDGVMDQESAYLSLLDLVRTYEIREGNLTMFGEDDTRLLQYVPPAEAEAAG